MDVHHPKIGTNRPYDMEHRFYHPVGGVSANVAECTINLPNLISLPAEAPRLLRAWTTKGWTIDWSVHWIINTHSQRTREHLLPTRWSVTHIEASEELYTCSNPITRECPKPIEVSVKPAEHPLEPNRVTQRQPTLVPGTAEHPSVRTECPIVREREVN